MAKKQTEDDILKSALARVQGDEEGEAPLSESDALESAKSEERARKAKEGKAKAKALAALPEESKVTYTPLEQGDPIFTMVAGHKFIANKPVKVANKELVLMLKANPWFEVDGGQVERVMPEPRDDDGQDARSLVLKKGQKEVDLEDVD